MAAAAEAPRLVEAESIDDETHFFRRLGEVLLLDGGGDSVDAPLLAMAECSGKALVYGSSAGRYHRSACV